MANVAPRQGTFDDIVVGSGATGGWAAMELTEAGLRVAPVEAGRNLIPEKDSTEHVILYQIKYRGHSPEIEKTRPIQQRCYACMEYNYEWFVNDYENPYTTAPDKPCNGFRLRILGGRSVVWGRQSYRLSALDFKAATQDGYGDDWPISYAELAPWYDKAEEFVGISGAAKGIPQLPDGKFLPPMPMTCGEVMLRKAVKQKFGRTVTIGRTVKLTAPVNGRPPCHYCGPCERGCMTESYFNSPTTTIEAAQATGRLTRLTDAVVSDGDNEKKMGEDIAASAVEMLEAAGAKNVRPHAHISPFGHPIHEVGVARTGSDPKKSVVNKYCQAHDVMAIVCHSYNYLIKQARKGEFGA